ncbi:hypothetical protein NQZ68_002016 [Dissostichus eleginoides]|nr:hypothetical protein NQZ68_002016 [Dissostichus eleginoides]
MLRALQAHILNGFWELGQASLRNDERRKRQAGEESATAVCRLTARSYSDGLSVVYQMTGAEVRHSAGAPEKFIMQE